MSSIHILTKILIIVNSIIGPCVPLGMSFCTGTPTASGIILLQPSGLMYSLCFTGLVALKEAVLFTPPKTEQLVFFPTSKTRVSEIFKGNYPPIKFLEFVYGFPERLPRWELVMAFLLPDFFVATASSNN